MNSFVKYVALLVVIILTAGCGENRNDENTLILPGINTFLAEHSHFGTPQYTENFPNWAQGQRQIVQFKNGRSLLFYLSAGEVVSVYENTGKEGRKKIWGSYSAKSAEYATNLSKPQDGAIPQYKVISAINLISGGRHADILIPSLSRNTAHKTLSNVAFQILEKEKLISLNMYSTQAAYKADYSSSFAEQNPTASQGRLGSISAQTGKFDKW